MAGCSDQRLRERLIAPRFATNEELNHETVKGAYRLGARMGVREFGAAAGLVDQAFWLESVTNQGDRQNPHQRPVAIVVFVPTAGLLGGRARLEAIKSRFGGVADVEDNGDRAQPFVRRQLIDDASRVVDPAGEGKTRGMVAGALDGSRRGLLPLEDAHLDCVAIRLHTPEPLRGVG